VIDPEDEEYLHKRQASANRDWNLLRAMLNYGYNPVFQPLAKAALYTGARSSELRRMRVALHNANTPNENSLDGSSNIANQQTGRLFSAVVQQSGESHPAAHQKQPPRFRHYRCGWWRLQDRS